MPFWEAPERFDAELAGLVASGSGRRMDSQHPTV
jgi:hypothetical protein